MKPKPRGKTAISTSPQQSPCSSPRPLVKRRRIDSADDSIDQKCSTSFSEGGGVVIPPPEYQVYDYQKECPRLMSVIGQTDDFNPDREDVRLIQHELEGMLAHAVDFQRRAHGELVYLNTGEYPPMGDIKKRPMPTYELHVECPLSPTASDSISRSAIIPPDEPDDDMNVWPPPHVPTRFWKWMALDMPAPDYDLLDSFKEIFLDPLNPDATRHLYKNEPSTVNSTPVRDVKPPPNVLQNCRNSPPKRKLSLEMAEIKKEIIDPLELHTPKRELTVPCTPSTSRGIHTPSTSNGVVDTELDLPNVLELFDGMLFEYYKEVEIKKRDATPPYTNGVPNGYCNGFSDKKVIKSECMYDPDGYGELGQNGHETNGMSNGGSECNGWETPRANGKIHSPRRNGEKKHETNGYAETNGHQLTNGFTFPDLSLKEEKEDDEKIRAMVQSIPIDEKLNLISLMFGHNFNQLAHIFYAQQGSGGAPITPSKVEFNPEYEEESNLDEAEMDEVSLELLKAQDELRQLEPHTRELFERLYGILEGDVVCHEEMKKFNEIEEEVFALSARFYREVPRRVPTSSEFPILQQAIRERNRAAKKFYLKRYRRFTRIGFAHATFLNAPSDVGTYNFEHLKQVMEEEEKEEQEEEEEVEEEEEEEDEEESGEDEDEEEEMDEQ